MTELKREEIIGQTIMRIHAVEESRDGLDITRTFYSLASGIVFFMPLACCRFISSTVPSQACLLRGPVIQRCAASPISRVLATQEGDGFIDPDSLVMELISGDCHIDLHVAPHGSGLSGLRVYCPGELSLSRHRDFWTLDHDADELAILKP